jgi:putative CocE/NonD family hydrolase
MPSAADDRHWLGARAVLLPVEQAEAMRRSRHLRMRDGVPIAIDAYVPRTGAPVATILRQTRYARSLLPRSPLGPRVLRLLDHTGRMRRAFLAAGFAWIDVDVRGSGASGGTQAFSWNPDEVKDGAEVVDWIVRQPWSSGQVGSLGVSYDGTCAEMLLVNRHPAVRAIAPLFSLFDVYTDIAFPGGIHLAWFTEHWGRFNALLDRNATADAFALVVWMMARARVPWLPEARTVPLVASLLARVQAGVRPVDGAALADAMAGHAANYQVHEGALQITHRDDRGVIATHPDATVDAFSPHAFAADTAASGAAIYSYSGWRDGAYMGAAIKRHHALATPGSRLTIGPWTHGGRASIAPFAAPRAAAFDHAAELVSFFAHHLQGRPDPGDGRPVHYFTMGENRWKSAATWPPPGTATRTLFLAERALTPTAPTASAHDRHRVDPRTGSGPRSRWRCMIAPVPSDYPDRAARDAHLLHYDSPPLPIATEVTGQPRVILHVAWLDATDAQLFAYLEDVAPDGRVAHVTEGMLRALHRAPARTFLRADAAPLIPGAVTELACDLLPVSHLFAAGHRIRLALAFADADSFAPTTAATLDLHRSAPHPTRLDHPRVTPRGHGGGIHPPG